MTDAPDPIDVHVGAMIRRRRQELKVSQERLAQALGVTFQQVQKYERGLNRVSASTLFRVAKALKQPPAWFFPAEDDARPNGLADDTLDRFAGAPGALEVAERYLAMDATRQQNLRNVARALDPRQTDAVAA